MSGITTEGIDAGGAHPQPSHECTEESADICSSLRGTYGPLCRFAIPSSPLPSGVHFPIINFGVTTSPRDPVDFPRVTQVGMPPPPSSHFGLEGL